MSVSLWAYDPDICDGDYCPMDCDRCYRTGNGNEPIDANRMGSYWQSMFADFRKRFWEEKQKMK